jgi:hypothetical protein
VLSTVAAWQTFMDQNKGWLFFVEWVPAWTLYRWGGEGGVTAGGPGRMTADMATVAQANLKGPMGSHWLLAVIVCWNERCWLWVYQYRQ